MSPARIEPTSEELDLVRSGAYSAGRLAHRVGRHVSVVKRWAKEAGVDLPDQHAHRVDAGFFRRWTPEMAYVLGFIAADGCVLRNSDTNGSLEIGISSRDRALLVAIRETMRIHRDIYDRTTNAGTERSTLGVGSIELVDDLIRLGVGPRKSATLAWPNELPDDQVSQFVLGYFDGDGCADIVRTRNHGHRYERLRIRLVGTYEFLEALADEAWSSIGWMGALSRDRRSSNLWELTYLGSSAEAFGHWMYRAAVPGLHLSRKRNIIEGYLNQPSLREHRKGKLTFDDAEAIRDQWASGEYTQAQLAERYGVTRSNISCIVRNKSMVKRHFVRQ